MWGAGTRWGAASARELKVNRSNFCCIRRKRPSGLRSPAPEKRQTGLHTRGVMANEGPVDASELRHPHCSRVRALPARGRPSRHRRTRASRRLPVATVRRSLVRTQSQGSRAASCAPRLVRRQCPERLRRSPQGMAPRSRPRAPFPCLRPRPSPVTVGKRFEGGASSRFWLSASCRFRTKLLRQLQESLAAQCTPFA